MADSMRDIKRRIKSVNSTKQITHAMELVASAKLRKIRSRAEARRAYTSYVIETMRVIAASLRSDTNNVFLKPNKAQKDLYIIVTSDKGLAGGFNSNLLKFAVEEMSKSASPAVAVFGNKGHDFLSRRNYEIMASFVGNSENADLASAKDIGNKVSKMFVKEEVGNVYIIYNRFISMLTQKPSLVKLLPLTSDEMLNVNDSIDTFTLTDENAEYKDKKHIFSMLFEPTPEELAEKLLPMYIDNAIYGALLESSAGELASRRFAMENATDNADELIGKFTLAYNRARQGAITQEITEIVGGADAIS